jgi:hypothetical protein
MAKGRRAVTCPACGEDYPAGWPRCPGCSEPNPRSGSGFRFGGLGLLALVLPIGVLLVLLAGLAAWVALGPR